MDELYQQNILDHYKHPHHKGALHAYTHSADGSNPSCGDSLMLYLEITSGVVTNVGFEGEGCAISTAAMSMLGDKIIGMELSQLTQLTPDDIYELLGVVIGPAREKCALLSLTTLQKAVSLGSV